MTEIRQLVDTFYQSDCGLEYIHAMKDHRNNYYSRGSSSGSISSPFYQPPTLPTVRTMQPPSVNNPSMDIESQGQGQQRPSGSLQRTSDSASPPRFVSPRQSLNDIFELMFESPSHSILEQLSHNSNSHQKLMAELEYVHKTIEENDTWKLVDELYDPVLILTANEPHIILKCSMSWLSMMGCKSSQIFGKILENFIYFPELEEANPLSSLPSSTQNNSSSSSIPNMTQQEVITTLEELNHQLNSHQSPHIHCILPLQHCNPTTTTNNNNASNIIKCSIHCYPIYKKLSDEELSESDKPRYFLQKSGRDSSSSHGNQHHSVAYYIMYFNHFIMDTPPPSSTTNGGTRLRSFEENGENSATVSTTEMSPISSQLSSTSMSTNLTERLRKQGLANDL